MKGLWTTSALQFLRGAGPVLFLTGTALEAACDLGNPRNADEAIDNAAGRRHVAQGFGNEVDMKGADQSPVQCSNDDEGCNDLTYGTAVGSGHIKPPWLKCGGQSTSKKAGKK